MQCTSGYSVLTSVEGVQNLVDFFHLTSGACQHFVVPFELKGVTCNKRTNLMSNQDSTDLMQSDFASRLIEQHNDKSTKIRDYKRAQRKNESPEQRERRLAKAREYKRLKLHSESLEERQSRLTKCCEYASTHRKNESSEQREKRLTNARQERKCRLEKYCEYARTRRKNESSEQREKGLAKNRSYKKSVRGANSSSRNKDCLKSGSDVVNITQLIKNFHRSVSTGPLYICTCDQLWYKHSVSPADRVRLANPDLVKYLQNIKSVDKVDWLCSTCGSHL